MIANTLRRVRPSNLVLLAALPFIVFLFASSDRYQRSLAAILGIEHNAGALLAGFLLLLGVFASGAILAFRALGGEGSAPALAWAGRASLVLHPALILIFLLFPGISGDYIDSVIAHEVDPYSSEWIVEGERPRILTPEYRQVAVSAAANLMLVYGAALVGLLAAGRYAPARPARWALRALLAVNAGCGLYILFVAHGGFANGFFVTLRATVFAYIAAAIVGLILAGLQGLAAKPRTIGIYGIVAVLLVAGSAWFFLQPKETFVLVGTLEERVAIIRDTPKNLADAIKDGSFEGGDGTSVRIRSAEDADAALALVATADNISAAFVPIGQAPDDLDAIWQVTFLPDRHKTPGVVLASLGVLLAILTFGAFLHGRHPLAVGAEFFIDTVRGIPMLVIILYVGLPLSGAVKDASGGAIDLPNFVRGVIAISIGYSAYMAEIFRAGIEAIPQGQIEAAKSLGMSRWQVARLIILPQALRIVTPPLGNEFIAMLKDTSLLSILSVRDVTQRMREFQAASFLPFAPFNSAAILYVALTLACASGLKWIERRNERRPR